MHYNIDMISIEYTCSSNNGDGQKTKHVHIYIDASSFIDSQFITCSRPNNNSCQKKRLANLRYDTVVLMKQFNVHLKMIVFLSVICFPQSYALPGFSMYVKKKKMMTMMI